VAQWYNGESFDRLVAAKVAHDQDHGRETLARQFIAGFRGMARSGAQKAVLAETDAARMSLAMLLLEKRQGELLAVLKDATRPVKPADLGIIGRHHLEDAFDTYGANLASFKYRKVTGITDDVPWLIEAAFAWCPKAEARALVTGCNWTPSLGETFDGLAAHLEVLRVSFNDPVMVAVHLAYPAAIFTDKGKTELALPVEIEDAWQEAVSKVTAIWTKQKKAEDRNASARARREAKLARKGDHGKVKRAAYAVMVEAYLAASAKGTLPANARQVMYAARRDILEVTGEPRLDDGYFTQTLLPDFQNDHPDLTAGWDIAYDDRGHLIEPHTDRVIGLGTLAVREYIGACKAPAIVSAAIKDAHIVTVGPSGRFGGLVYIEKEGFQALFTAVQLAKRFDLAIMSSKGMSVTAARELAEAICSKYKIPLYILHDFDKAGMSIAASFERSNRRYTFTEKFKVFDLGLRLDDVCHEDLLGFSEPHTDRGSHEARAKNMERNGATPKEIEFLLHRRVELNAFTSDRFVAYIERKLAEHGVRKIVPSKALLQQTYRAVAHSDLAKPGIERAIAEATKTRVAVPLDLQERVNAFLEDNPECPWDVAVAKIARGEQ